MTTQCEKIINYCKENGSITSMEAFSELGITRLASRVHDLRNAGYDVESTTVTGKNRDGDSTRWSVYTIKER